MSAQEPRGLTGRVAEAIVGRVTSVVPPEMVIRHVDVEAVLDEIDLDAMLDRIDVNHLLDRIDVNRLLDRVDVDRLLDRVDVDAVMSGVTVDALVRRADMGSIVTQTTGQLAEGGLDSVRRPLVGVDTLISRAVDRVLHRGTTPVGPPALVGRSEPGEALTRRTVVSGRYAGGLTRAIAAAIDVALGLASYAAAMALLGWLVDTLLRHRMPEPSGIGATIAIVAWVAAYVIATTIVSGRTLGKAVVGLRVVQRDGTPVTPLSAVVRVLATALCVAVLGLGLVWLVVDRKRRGLHDLIAHTAVVYDWGDRPAQLPAPLSAFLRRHDA